MAEQDVKNAEKAYAYFLQARRKAAAGLASNLDKGMSSSNDHAVAQNFALLQSGVEAAKAALDQENSDPAYLSSLSEKLMDG